MSFFKQTLLQTACVLELIWVIYALNFSLKAS